MMRLLPLIASGFLWERRPRRDRASQTTTHRPEGGAPTGIAASRRHTLQSHRRNTGEQNSNFSVSDHQQHCQRPLIGQRTNAPAVINKSIFGLRTRFMALPSLMRTERSGRQFDICPRNADLAGDIAPSVHDTHHLVHDVPPLRCR